MIAGRRAIVSTGTAAMALGPVGARAAETSIDLTAITPDGSLKDFTVARTGRGAPAVWAVRPDASVSFGRVLVQTGDDPTDYRFPLAIYRTINAVDVEVGVRFKALSGRVDRAGGLVVRFLDPDNYYVVRANALEDNVNFYRVVKGSRREIKGASVRVASDQWHRLGLRAEGDTFAVLFAGKALFTVTDRTFVQSGGIGLWTKADSVTAFDSLAVTVMK